MHNARGVEVVECSVLTELQCNHSQNKLLIDKIIQLNDLSFFGLENSQFMHAMHQRSCSVYSYSRYRFGVLGRYSADATFIFPACAVTALTAVIPNMIAELNLCVHTPLACILECNQ